MFRKLLIGASIVTTKTLYTPYCRSFSDSQPKTRKDFETCHDYIDYVIPSQIVKNNKVVLFMKGTPAAPQCGFSNYVVTALSFYGVSNYFSVNVLEDDEIRSEIKKYSDWPTIPQLYVDAKFVGGCDIITEMHNKNELKDFFINHSCVDT